MTTAEVATSVVLRRVRDPNGTAHSRAFVRSVLSHVELLLNAKLALVTREVVLTLIPLQQIYAALSESYGQVARVVGIHDGAVDLPQVDWTKLHHYDRAWFRKTGSRPLVWAPFGRDALIVHPGLDQKHDVTIHYAVAPVPLTQEDDVLTIPDQHLPLVYDMAEALLLLKQRVQDPQSRAIFDAVFQRGMGRFATDGEGRRTPTRSKLVESTG